MSPPRKVGQASSLSLATNIDVPTPSLCAIGVDVGGTKIAAAAVEFPSGRILSHRIFPTLPQRDGEAILADVEQAVAGLSAQAQSAGLPLVGIGVGLCEIVDGAGRVRSAQTVAWRDLPVRERLARFGPTLVEADVRAAARAEALFGAGRDTRVFLYVSIGTGISSCLVIDGAPFPGASGATGTMASGPLPCFQQVPGDLRDVTLEQVASGPALVARFKQVQGSANSAQEVLAAARAGQVQAVEVVRSAAAALGGTIGLLINVLDPGRVIFGGGLGLDEGLFRQELIQAARRHVWWEGHRELPMVSAATGADAGVIGAAATAWREFSRP